MKRVYVNEEWCLGCHLCEYNCAFAESGVMQKCELYIFPDSKKVELDDGTEVPYTNLCLATGSSPFVPPFEGLDTVKTVRKRNCPRLISSA